MPEPNQPNTTGKPDSVLCPIESIGYSLEAVNGPGLVCELVRCKGKWFLRYRGQSSATLGLPRDADYLRFKWYCIGLSIAVHGHFWTHPLVVDDNLGVVWSQERKIALEGDLEWPQPEHSRITAHDILVAEDVATWIAKTYPRVFSYCQLGLFLLRSDFPSEYVYADALLNFYKVVELVGASRTKKKLKERVIAEASMELGITGMTREEMKTFYQVRARDVAHDYDQARRVTRRQAVRCKLWAEEMLLADMNDRMGPGQVRYSVQSGPDTTTVACLDDESKDP